LFIENPQAMWIFDLRSLRFLAVNNAALRQYGFTPQEFMSLSPRDLLSPETLPAFLQDAPKPCAGVESHGLWRHRRKDGTVFNAEITALDLRYGEIPARLVLVRDVTERWLRDQQSLATRKMELIRQMAGGFAHHFNNILTIIDGHANLLLRKPQDQGNTEQLTKISTAANRAAALTRQFVAVGGRQALRLEPVSLNTELQTLIPTLKRLLGDRIELQTSLGPGLPLVLADTRSVEHVVLNLVLNARAAISSEGTVSIATSGVRIDEARAKKHPQARPGPFVRLTVRDNGCGMTPEVQAHLFEPFFTTHDVGGGTGLGLASIYGAVSQHSGWIEYSTELGSGTEFSIFFPCAPASALTAQAGPQAPPAPAAKTILVVEPCERARTLARFILTRHGYRVIEADSAATVLALWGSQAKQVDLLVTELNGSGDVSGGAFADELRKTRPDLRVLFTSVPALDSEQSIPGRLEGQNFVQKPFTAGGLLPAVDACLSAKASARC
jgi:PAS domain S-box-containing protein